jgi:hypothetical protein
MKRCVLLLLLLGAVGSAQAQAPPIFAVSNGLTPGQKAASSKAAKPKAPAAGLTMAQYRGQEYPRQRTPDRQLSRPNLAQVAYQEKLLQKCQNIMLSDTVSALGHDNLWATIKASQEVIMRDHPTWSVQAYQGELAFYMAEDARRRALAQPVPAP